jgi:error-prone DNA polymerase
MGFYAPAQIVIDAKRHGVEVRGVDVAFSQWECTLENEDTCGGEASTYRPLRLGMNRVKGLRQEDAEAITAARSEGPFTSIEALWKASRASTRALRLLAAADAFGSMDLDRQSALWHARKLREEDVPLFDFGRHDGGGGESGCSMQPDTSGLHRDLPVPLPALPELRHVVQDYGAIGLSLRPHPVHFLRPFLDSRRAIKAAELADEKRFPSGRGVTVGGLCLVRQRPGTSKGIVFMTIEDETGVANLVVRPQVYDRFRAVVRGAGSLLVRGRVDRAGEVVHVVATSMESMDDHLASLRSTSRDFH